METSVHRDRRRRRRRDDGLFFPDHPARHRRRPRLASHRVSRLASLRKNRYVRDGYETPARDRSARLHARPRASTRPIARADRSRIFFSARSAHPTLTSAAGIARARRSSESRGAHARDARREMARTRVTRACARARVIVAARVRARARRIISPFVPSRIHGATRACDDAMTKNDDDSDSPPIVVADASWRRLRGMTRAELRLRHTLPTGQSFRWRSRGDGDSDYVGVIGRRVVRARERPDGGERAPKV